MVYPISNRVTGDKRMADLAVRARPRLKPPESGATRVERARVHRCTSLHSMSNLAHQHCGRVRCRPCQPEGRLHALCAQPSRKRTQPWCFAAHAKKKGVERLSSRVLTPTCTCAAQRGVPGAKALRSLRMFFGRTGVSDAPSAAEQRTHMHVDRDKDAAPERSAGCRPASAGGRA